MYLRRAEPRRLRAILLAIDTICTNATFFDTFKTFKDSQESSFFGSSNSKSSPTFNHRANEFDHDKLMSAGRGHQIIAMTEGTLPLFAF
jgi:hypothetical protein